MCLCIVMNVQVCMCNILYLHACMLYCVYFCVVSAYPISSDPPPPLSSLPLSVMFLITCSPPCAVLYLICRSCLRISLLCLSCNCHMSSKSITRLSPVSPIVPQTPLSVGCHNLLYSLVVLSLQSLVTTSCHLSQVPVLCHNFLSPVTASCPMSHICPLSQLSCHLVL